MMLPSPPPSRLQRALLRLYPPAFRRRYGTEILDLHRRMDRGSNRVGTLRLALEALRHGPATRFEYRRRRRLAGRDTRGGTGMDILALELRQALRQLSRRRAESALIVATLALAIGAATAIFSLVDQVLLRPLAFAEPERLVRFWTVRDGARDQNGTIAYLDLFDWAARSGVLEAVAAYDEWTPSLAGVGAGPGEPARLTAATVSANFFSLLGVAPRVGRFFLPEEDEDGKDAVVVLSHGLWQRRFGGDPQVVGRVLLLDGAPHEVVGVAPPLDEYGLAGERRDRAELWRPNGYLGVAAERLPNRGSESWAGIGRLRDGVSRAQAEREVANVAAMLEREYPDSNSGRGVVLLPLQQQIVGATRPSLLLLGGAVALLFLIALVNVAGVLLGRAAARLPETALRAALGAGRWGLLRRDLAEGLILSSLGCLLAIPIAWAAIRLLAASIGDELPRPVAVGLDGRVIVFAVLASLLAGAACSAAPGLSLLRRAVSRVLREGAATLSGTRAALRARSALVVAEVGLSLALLFGAALLAIGLSNLHRVDTGLEDADRVLTFELRPSRAAYPDAAAVDTFYRRLLARLEALPGVRSVALTNIVPLSGSFDGNGVWAEDWPERTWENELSAQTRTVSVGFFETMGVKLERGRFFDRGDDAGEPVAILNRELAQRLWPGKEGPGRDPIDRFVRSSADDSRPIRVVGVVADVKHLALDEDAPPQIYLPRAQGLVVWQLRRATVVVRAEGDPLAADLGLVAAVRETVHGLDPALPIANLQTMSQLIDRSVASPRLRTLLTLTFALAALLLTTVGLYAVISHAVTMRRREMAIRMALGAVRAQVANAVLRHTLALVGVGLALGAVLSLATGRLLARFVFELDWTRAAVFGLVPVALMLAAAVLASLAPALRATRVEPSVTLREG